MRMFMTERSACRSWFYPQKSNTLLMATKCKVLFLYYTFSNSLNYDTSQYVFEDLSYPVAGDAAPSDDVIITQIIAHVDDSDGMDCQIYIMKVDIGEKSITLQLMALNTYSLRYVVVGYDKKCKESNK